MTKYEVIINGVSIDLYSNTIIAQTLKAIEIGDLTTRKFNFTNTIRVPSTKINDGVFGIAWNYLSDTNIPYIKLSAKIKVNGIETVSDGIAQILSANNGYSINIISGSKSFFATLENKMLSDITVFMRSSSAAGKAALRNSTSGVLYPVAYYGENELGNSVHTNMAYIYDYSILEAIFDAAGYTYSGAFLSIPKFEKQVTSAYTMNGYTDSFIDTRRVSVNKNIAQSDSVSNGGGLQTKRITFNEVKQDGIQPYGYWDAATHSYKLNDPRIPTSPTPATPYRLLYRFTFDITIPVGSTVNVAGFNNIGSGVYSFDNINDNTGGSVMFNGTEFALEVTYNSSPGFIPIPFTVNSAMLTIQPNRIPLGSTFINSSLPSYDDYAGLLPDIEQKEFIRNVMIQYGLIPSEDNGHITFTSINEIINSKSVAFDWSRKRVKNDDDISFTPLSYAQINKFTYDNKDQNITKDYGAGIFEVANQNATITKEIFKSLYSACTESIEDSLLVAYIPLFNGEPIELNAFSLAEEDIFNNEPGIRSLLVRSKYASEPSVTYENATSYSDYLALYFDSPNESDSMSLQQFIDDNYSLLIESLQKSKVLQRQYLLTETDIAMINFKIPVFDTDSYFLINVISNFIPDKSTTVELFKII